MPGLQLPTGRPAVSCYPRSPPRRVASAARTAAMGASKMHRSAPLQHSACPQIRQHTRRLRRSSFRGQQLRADLDIVGQRYLLISRQRRGSHIIMSATLVGEQPVAAVDELLNEELEQMKDLVVGHLANGLKYVICPGKVPRERFEAHLEVHVGSVDEREDEQGMAHIVEHVTFLGSEKRDNLLGIGTRSNAYTDFHHTVYHVHSPLTHPTFCQPMLPQVLDALVEVAFEPKMEAARLEKERKAVLAEAQMMNTIEYRVDCQLLRYLHGENAVGHRFPIGKVDQVQKWTRDQVHSFWERWYFPANATLYVAGDFGMRVPDVERLIQNTFGRIPAGRHKQLSSDNWRQPSDGELKKRHEKRPPVEHIFGLGPPPPGFKPAPVEVFRHRLLERFMLTIFCKLPVRPINRMRDVRHSFMLRVMFSVLQFRINQRYVSDGASFLSIESETADSGREGCAVTLLTVQAEPKDWDSAVRVAIQEVRRLQKFGVSADELEVYKAALLRDSQQMAEGTATTASWDKLDFIMESMANKHTIADNQQLHNYIMKLSDTITVEGVNALARSILSAISHYGREAELFEEAGSDPLQNGWAWPGPTWATSVVACLPAFMDASGNSTGSTVPLQRGASMTTSEHIDPAVAAAQVAAMEEDPDTADIPEGAVKFELEAHEIQAALMEDSIEVEPLLDLEVPSSLLPADQLEALLAERRPHFVPVEDPSVDSTGGRSQVRWPAVHEGLALHEGIQRRRLSNGIRINSRRTMNEPHGAMLRMVAAGGRAADRLERGPAGLGAVPVATRTLSESGAVGPWRRDQVELFSISKLITCMMEPDDEWLCMDFHFNTGDGGLKAVLEMLHMLLEQPVWDPSALDRAKQLYSSSFRSLPKSLERSTSFRLAQTLNGEDRRFQDPTPEDIEALSLEGCQQVMDSILHAANLEISVVGDIDQAELDDLALKYLGTVAAREAPKREEAPIVLQQPASPVRLMWHLKDSDERAMALIAGRAPARWGPFEPHPALQHVPEDPVQHAWQRQKERKQLLQQLATQPVRPPVTRLPANVTLEEVERVDAIRRGHPVYALVTLNLLMEVVNGRLFGTVRDTLGLTYDVSFEMHMHDRLGPGLFVISTTSTPDKIQEAADAALQTLRNLHTSRVTMRELERSKRSVLTRHESDLKGNVYWLGLLTHLQSPEVPLKNLASLRDLVAMYEAAKVEDLYDALASFSLDDESVFTCIGVSGKTPPAQKDFQEQNKGNLLNAQMRQHSQRMRSTRSLPGGNGAGRAQQQQSSDLDPKETANAVVSAFLAAMRNGDVSGVQAQQQRTD